MGRLAVDGPPNHGDMTMQLFQLVGLVQKPLNAKQETALAEALKKALERKQAAEQKAN